MARNYSNVAVATALTASINGSDTSITVGSNTGYPTAPYSVILDPGTPSEEVVEVTAVGGTTWTVTRGVDGTSATSHASAAVVEHGVSARDWREPNEHVSATTSVHGIANTTNLVTLAGSQTLTNKTLTSPTLNGGTWASPSFTGGTFTSPTLVTPTIASFTNAQHTHTDAASGGVVSSGSSAFFFPAPVVVTDTDSSLIAAAQDMPSCSITYTAPDAWPDDAKRILYNVTFEFGSGTRDFEINFASDGTELSTNWIPLAIDNVSLHSSFTISWPGALTSTGASHTAKARIDCLGGTLGVRAFWLSLI